MEHIDVFLIGRNKPISFIGVYLGHKRPDGKIAENWHYYKDRDGTIYHFRKERIDYIKSTK